MTPFEFSFEFSIRGELGSARAGTFVTSHGAVETPAFMAVGTLATVKALDPVDLREIGAPMILGNAYHLHLRPATSSFGISAACTRSWAGMAQSSPIRRLSSILIRGIAHG